MTLNTFESDVPPLKRSEGCPSGRLNRLPKAQQIQKSFSATHGATPTRAAVSLNSRARSDSSSWATESMSSAQSPSVSWSIGWRIQSATT